MTEVGWPLLDKKHHDRLALVALVQENIDNGGSTFELLSNIFGTFLIPQKGKLFNKELFISESQTVFGEDFTELVADLAINILHNQEYLYIEVDSDPVVYRVAEDLKRPPPEAGPSLERSFGMIVESFWRFFYDKAESLPFVEEEVDKADWENDLFLWLTSASQSTREQIEDSVTRLLQGKHITGNVDDSLDEEPIYSSIDNYRLFRFAQFVRYCQQHDDLTLQQIFLFSDAGFAFRVIRGFSGAPEWLGDEKVNLTLVLDGPVILDLVGLSGESRREAIQRVLALALQLEIKVITLTHCIEEAVEVIQSVMQKDRVSRWGMVGDAIRRNPKLEQLARSFQAHPDKLVQRAGVSITSFDPAQYPNQHAFFTQDLIDEFTSKAHFGGFGASVVRRQRDAYSFGFVVRRRGEAIASDYFQSRYLLLTQNSTFVQFAERFVRDHLPSIPKYAAGYVIEASVLASLLWLRIPSGDTQQIPRLQLFATCQRILASNKSVIESAKRRAKDHSQEFADQLELFLRVPLVVEELMVVNSRNSVSTIEADSLLHIAKNAAIEEERKKFSSEKSKLKRKHAKEVKRIEDDGITAKEGLEKAARKASEAQAEISLQVDHHETRLLGKFDRVDQRFDLLNGILFLVLGGVALFSLSKTDFEGIFQNAWFLATAAFGALSLIIRAPFFGPRAKGLYTRWRKQKIFQSWYKHQPAGSVREQASQRLKETNNFLATEEGEVRAD
ncbi:hypothetical protein [Henriciella sp.]|uniref:hypothetical protein n=1 Tax=Henriciella sp. TaxID=1968823 RepID=UPI002605A793|nr:hypothetical protein [Henriciella sp.]